MVLEGTGSAEMFSSEAPSRPGIFGVHVKPAKAGEYRMTVRVSGKELTDSHDVGPVTVYPDETAAAKHPVAKLQEETIAFLKEQQWSLEFGTEVAGERTQRASVVVPAEVQSRAGGQAEATASIDGRIVEAAAVRIAQNVERGQVLVRIAPATSVPADRRSLELARAEAEN